MMKWSLYRGKNFIWALCLSKMVTIGAKCLKDTACSFLNGAMNFFVIARNSPIERIWLYSEMMKSLEIPD